MTFSFKRMILPIAGALCSLLAIAVFALALFGLPGLAAHSVWFLEHFHGSTTEPRNYDALYAYASQVTAHRNSLSMSLTLAIGVLLAALAITIFLWLRDERRQTGKASQPTRSH